MEETFDAANAGLGNRNGGNEDAFARFQGEASGELGDLEGRGEAQDVSDGGARGGDVVRAGPQQDLRGGDVVRVAVGKL